MPVFLPQFSFLFATHYETALSRRLARLFWKATTVLRDQRVSERCSQLTAVRRKEGTRNESSSLLTAAGCGGGGGARHESVGVGAVNVQEVPAVVFLGYQGRFPGRGPPAHSWEHEDTAREHRDTHSKFLWRISKVQATGFQGPAGLF